MVITFLVGPFQQLEHVFEPPKLHVQRVRRDAPHVEPHALEEAPVQRRRAGHREVRPVEEVGRRLAGEVRRRERQPERLRCART